MPERTALEPLAASHRVAIIDILRGWALLGVVIMNYMVFFSLAEDAKAYDYDTAGKALRAILNLLFVSKSWTLLSCLFGYGFAVLISNLEKKGLNPVSFFIRRMWWLFVFAFINSAFFFGDILKDYAIMGLVLLCFRRLKGKTILILSGVLFLLVPIANAMVGRVFPASDHMPALLPLLKSQNISDVFLFHLKATYYQEVIQPNYAITVHLMMLACGLLGFATFKYDTFNRVKENKSLIKKIFWYSLAAKIGITLVAYLFDKLKLEVANYYNPRFLGVLATIIWIGAAIYWLLLSGKAGRFLKPLEAMGRMTLTNYIVQNIISMLIFSGVGVAVFRAHHPGFYVGIALIVFFVQIIFSQWWLSRYQFGPVEWIWRQLSYRKHLPIRRSPHSAN